MINIIKLCKSYKTAVLYDVNIQFPDKGFVALIGESGCGKSTLLKCIGLLEKPTSGDVLYGDKNLTSLNSIARENERSKIFSYISQNISLIENTTLDKGLSFFNQDPAKRKKILENLGILDKKDELARNLSNGERQKVAIAQALLRDTPVLLCDEITANLDQDNAKQIYQILKEISKHKLIICVGHDCPLLENYADRILLLQDGKISEDKEVDSQIFDNQSTPPLGKKTRLDFGKFFNIFGWNMKAKLARTIFCAIFLFISLSSFCFGITQLIVGTDGLIRKQAQLLGIDFVKITDYQQDSYIAVNSVMDNDWRVFVDFEKEKNDFVLIDGRYPTNEHEVIISQFMAKFEDKKVGDNVYITYDDNAYTISGIFKSDISNYPIRDDVMDNFVPYATLTAVYFSNDFITFYEDNVIKGRIQDAKNNNYIKKYTGQSILAGRNINPNKKDDEILVTTKYLSYKYGYDIQTVNENPAYYFNNLDKIIEFNGKQLVIVGICNNGDDYAFLKEGPILHFDSTAGYVMPVNKVTNGNFFEHDFVATSINNYKKWSKIGMLLFGIFTLLSIVLFINLNMYEIDEKKILFRTMHHAGFSSISLRTYTLVVDMIILALSFALFLLVSLPIIVYFQLVSFGGIKYYIYVFNGWSILIALTVMTIVAILSYLVTLPRFSKELIICSKW